jgi:hypothetical protein
MRIDSEKFFPMTLYLFVLLVIMGMTLYFSPSWGFMDDYQNLQNVSGIQSSPNKSQLIFQELKEMPAGFARPVYKMWVISMYWLFKNNPTGMYLLIAILNMTALLVWGWVLYDYFAVERKYFYLMVFLYPLSFFIFTPFWNIFMYLSLQEKFVVWFSALSLFSFKRSYNSQKTSWVIYAFFGVILAVLSKPTGIYLAIVFVWFALLDLFFFNKSLRISAWHIILESSLFVGYAFFTFKYQLTNTYTSGYKENLGLTTLISKIFNSYFYIQGLYVLGIVFCLYFFVQSLRKKEASPFRIVFPLGLLTYLSILIPWGGQTYLQCALSPLIFATGVPVFIFLCNQNRFVKWATLSLFVVLIGSIVTGVIYPRIRKMAEKGYVVDFLRNHARNNQNAQFFYPPPFMETAFALKGFSGQDVVYADKGITLKTLSREKENYLLFDDQAGKLRLKGVRAETPIYKSHTWRVYPLVRDEGHTQVIDGDFNFNMMQKIKQKVRDFRS